MEESKYYTPELEEFCVGFEYEFKTKYTEGVLCLNNCREWTKFSFSADHGTNDEDSEIDCIKRAVYGDDLCEIRVKYLDREDIESLGWDHDQTTKDGAYFYFGTLMDQNQYLLVCENARQSKGGDYTNLSICNVNDGMNGGNGHCFDGVVKNKSELRKLMKMLQINL